MITPISKLTSSAGSLSSSSSSFHYLHNSDCRWQIHKDSAFTACLAMPFSLSVVGSARLPAQLPRAPTSHARIATLTRTTRAKSREEHDRRPLPPSLASRARRDVSCASTLPRHSKRPDPAPCSRPLIGCCPLATRPLSPYDSLRALFACLCHPRMLALSCVLPCPSRCRRSPEPVRVTISHASVSARREASGDVFGNAM